MKLRWLAALTVLYVCVAAAARAEEPIIIGQSAPLTGPAAALGKGIRDGANAVFAKVNRAGGIGGRQIQLLALDDGNDRKRAGANAKILIDEKKAVVLFGFASATLSLDAIALAEAKGMALFAPFSGSLSIRDKRPVFTIRASYRDESEKTIEYWAKFDANRMAVIHYDDEVGKLNFETVAGLLKQKGHTPLQVTVKRGASVDPALLLPIIKYDPQVIIVTTQAPQLFDLINFMSVQKKAYPISALSFVNPDELAVVKGNIAQGAIVSQVVPSPRSNGVAIVKECGETLAAAGTKLDYTTLEACIAAKVLVEGIKKGGKAITPQSIVTGLESLGAFDTGGFVVTFRPGAHHGSKWTDLSILARAGVYRH